jgi:hypothetical protein
VHAEATVREEVVQFRHGDVMDVAQRGQGSLQGSDVFAEPQHRRPIRGGPVLRLELTYEFSAGGTPPESGPNGPPTRHAAIGVTREGHRPP